MKKKTILDFYKMKAEGEKVSWITSYDMPFASFAEAAGIDMILVGDSLGMVVEGFQGISLDLEDHRDIDRLVVGAGQIIDLGLQLLKFLLQFGTVAVILAAVDLALDVVSFLGDGLGHRLSHELAGIGNLAIPEDCFT